MIAVDSWVPTPELVADPHNQRGHQHVEHERHHETLASKMCARGRRAGRRDGVERGDHRDGQMGLHDPQGTLRMERRPSTIPTTSAAIPIIGVLHLGARPSWQMLTFGWPRPAESVRPSPVLTVTPAPFTATPAGAGRGRGCGRRCRASCWADPPPGWCYGPAIGVVVDGDGAASVADRSLGPDADAADRTASAPLAHSRVHHQLRVAVQDH